MMKAMREAALTVDTEKGAWAEKLVQRLQHSHSEREALSVGTTDWVAGAITSLWRLFDEAVGQANVALEHSGLTERIALERTERELALKMVAPDNTTRHVTIFASLRDVDGHASGGAHITTSQTRASIHLAPVLEGGRLRWMIQLTGSECTPRVIDDLLLAIFGDDPAAMRRLSPSFTLDESM